MKIFKYFFINSYVLLISGIVTIASFSFYCIYELIFAQNNVSYLFNGFIARFLAVLALMLLIAYIKGLSAYQKTLIGAILALLLIYELHVLAFGIVNKNNVNPFFNVYELIKALVNLIIFFTHLYLQLDHNGDKKIMKFMSIAFTIAFVMSTYEFIMVIATNNAFFINYLWSIELISCLIFIICIETRITKYKMIRYEHLQNGTWTKEEKEKTKLIFKLFK